MWALLGPDYMDSADACPLRFIGATRYTISIKKIYAHGYGIPQRRKRVIVIGNRFGIPFSFPKYKHPLEGTIFRGGGLTVRDSIGDLANIDIPAIDHIRSFPSGRNKQRIALIGPGETMGHLPPELQHESWKRRANRRVIDGTPTEKRGGAPSGLKRLIYDEPSLTITGSATREFIHPIEDRLLTNREAARLQTFPDSFEFVGNDSSRIQQIGNAIPPKMAVVIADYIKSISTKGSYSSVQPGLLYYSLTESTGMSPALKCTDAKLSRLLINSPKQSTFLENA